MTVRKGRLKLQAWKTGPIFKIPLLFCPDFRSGLSSFCINKVSFLISLAGGKQKSHKGGRKQVCSNLFFNYRSSTCTFGYSNHCSSQILTNSKEIELERKRNVNGVVSEGRNLPRKRKMTTMRRTTMIRMTGQATKTVSSLKAGQRSPSPMMMTDQRRQKVPRAWLPSKTLTGKYILSLLLGNLPFGLHCPISHTTSRKPQKQKKVTAIEGDEGGASAGPEKPQLSRREREELERQRAKAHYQKLHAEGKTEEARADLARWEVSIDSETGFVICIYKPESLWQNQSFKYYL